MVAFVLSFWYLIGDSLLHQKHLDRLEWLFCEEEVEKSLGSYSFTPFLDNLVGEK